MKGGSKISRVGWEGIRNVVRVHSYHNRLVEMQHQAWISSSQDTPFFQIPLRVLPNTNSSHLYPNSFTEGHPWIVKVSWHPKIVLMIRWVYSWVRMMARKKPSVYVVEVGTLIQWAWGTWIKYAHTYVASSKAWMRPPFILIIRGSWTMVLSYTIFFSLTHPVVRQAKWILPIRMVWIHVAEKSNIFWVLNACKTSWQIIW